MFRVFWLHHVTFAQKDYCGKAEIELINDFRGLLGIYRRYLLMGGTICKTVDFWSLKVFKKVSGLKVGSVTILQPTANFDRSVTVRPYMWKNGKTQGSTSWWSAVVIGINTELCSACNIWQFDVILLCVSSTPFGKPVVPDEYGKKHKSSAFCILISPLKSKSKDKNSIKIRKKKWNLIQNPRRDKHTFLID